MENVVLYGQQYPLVVAALILFFLLACWKSEAVRGWVVRLVVLALVVAAIYFVFQKIRYRLPSPQEPPAISDGRGISEEHAGTKYYRDPEERLRQSDR
ncbi:MAG: hypothetical protein C0613_06065 [Desulfobulbaceae bacterium]|nr:MAG: hypothetical protein C0613_06065 [Desulfobulbaceae bacterium]